MTVKELRKKLHENPESSMHETETKKILMEFLKENASSLELHDNGKWFYALKKGRTGEKPIAFRADFDAVVCADGKAAHLCGHDGHSAVLAGFAEMLDSLETERDVFLIFQPGEETGEGAKICSGLICEKKIEEVYGFHNIPGFEENAVIIPGRTFACASTGLEIKLIGKETHAAVPENGICPDKALSKIILKMHEEISKEHRGIVLGTVIGIEAGSSSYGVAAGNAVLRLTLRAEYQDEYDEFVSFMEKTTADAADESNLKYEIKRIEEFPSTENYKECTQKVRTAAGLLDLKILTPSEPFRWSEDFGHYLKLAKGAFFGIGCGKCHPGLHTDEYEFNDEIIDAVTEIYKKLVMSE